VSLQEPVVIDLASHYKGNLTEKIELIKRVVHEQRLIEFCYYYEKGESHRCISQISASSIADTMEAIGMISIESNLLGALDKSIFYIKA